MTKFITLLLVAIVGLVLVGADVDEELKAHFHECVQDVQIDEKLALKLKDHDFSSDDPKLKCFAKCFCEKANICNANQDIDVTKIENHIADDKKPMVSKWFLVFYNIIVNFDNDYFHFSQQLEAALVKCNVVQGTDACDTVYQKFKCFFKEIHA